MRMTRHNNSITGVPYRCRCLGLLIFYCCVLVLIVSASTTLASESAESDAVAEKDGGERKIIVDAAKRLIRVSLWMDNEETPEFGFDSSSVHVDDLAIVLGPSFDRHEVESMVQDVRNELNDNGDSAINDKRTSTPVATTPTNGKCLASPLPMPSIARFSASKNDDDDDDDDDDGDSDDDYDHDDIGSRMTGDRHASALLDTIHDKDCLDTEFDVQNEDLFDVEDAIDVLRKCRILVLRNVFSEETIERVLPHYRQYISDVSSGKISSAGRTSFGGEFFILKEDNARFNYLATKELVEQSTGLLDNEIIMNILSHPALLGDSVIVNHVGTIDADPGADAQDWHNDGDYVHNDDVESNGYVGIGGHDLSPFAMNMFTPLFPRGDGMGLEHGPTEFCLGTSHLKGHDLEEDFPVDDPTLLTAEDGIVEHLQEFVWYMEQREMPPPNADCPDHLRRIPLLKEGDAVLFDYMLAHRGGANRSTNSNRSMVFATYSKKWFRDTNFDGGRPYSTILEMLTVLTQFAVVEETGK